MKRREFLRRSAVSSIAIATSIGGSAQAKSSADEITSMSASRLSQAIASQDISSVEVMQAYLQRIHQYNPKYNAIVSLVDDSKLLRQAEAADKALLKGEYWGWMHGMPHAIKDLADAQGLESTYGSPIFAGNVAKEDSLYVARIRAQGAIFIGKTNTPEFGAGSQTYNAVFGTTRNAYNPHLTAGGSSGGAAVGLAAELLPTADGSDMMGSLRNPAGFNNVIGFRPSQGRVPSPSSESSLFYDQLATDGPMGRNTEDTIRLLGTMAGYNSRAPLSLRDKLPPYEAFSPATLENIRIGWLGDYQGYLPMEAGVMSVCESALTELTQHGASLEGCTPDYELTRLWETWLTLRHWSWRAGKPLYDNAKTRQLLKPELQWEIEGSMNVTADRISQADRGRSDWYRALNRLFDDYDLLALPTAQTFPFPADLHWPTSIGVSFWSLRTLSFDLGLQLQASDAQLWY